jgi:hypothetical protein
MSKSLRKPDGTFAPGWRGGGRPIGARSRLTETALAMLGEHFAEFGKTAIDKVYREKPAVYLQIIASLLPKQVSIEKLSPFVDLSDQELDLLQEFLTAQRASPVAEIDSEAVDPTDAKQQQKP